MKIISWNANGVSTHGAQLKLYIQDSTNQPHIICIQETKLTSRSNFKIRGYKSETKNRIDKAGGGVAIFIKQDIPYERIDNIHKDLEGVSVKIHLENTAIHISSVYIPPRAPITTYDYLVPLLQHPNCIICGDLNAKNSLWGAPVNDPQGSRIEELIDNNLVVLNDGTGTRINNDGGRSHLDIAIASNSIAAKCNWSVLDDTWNSDHLPTIISINESPISEENPPSRFAFKKANWTEFEEISRNLITDSLLDPSIQVSCNNITDAIIKISEETIPRKKNRRKNKIIPYWNEECSRATKAKRKAKDRMERTRNIEDCINYRRAKAQAQRTIKQSGKDHWQSFCSSITTSTKVSSVWRMVKGMSGVRSQSTIPVLKEDGNVFVSNSDKAEALANNIAKNSSTENFEKIFLENRKRNHLDTTPLDQHQNHPVNDPFSLFELQDAIRQSKPNSSPGEDGICYEVIKHLPKSCQIVILSLLNRMWSEGDIPERWKHSIVLPIQKPGKDPSSLDSYRPIALTDSLCKINERIIANRLNWYMESNGLFNVNQSGFRKNKSCLDQIIRLQTDIENSTNKRGYTVGVFLDFTKAYDMLWIDGLIHKLINLGIGGNMFHWIKNFLTNRTFQVRVGGEKSASRRIENGTPQGSVVSPLLFLIMINDLPKLKNGVSTAIFADDTAFWKSGHNLDNLIKSVQESLDSAIKWCRTWGFILSKEKTVAITFHKRKENVNPTPLHIDKTNLQWKREVKFLGVVFDERLTWKAHINHIEDRCKKRMNLMRCISGQNWGADKKWLMHIYIAMIRSVIDYGSQAYITACSSQLERLDRIQAQALRICCGALKSSPTSALQVECGEQPLHLRRQSLELKLAVKVKATQDHPAGKIVQRVPNLGAAKSSFEKRTSAFTNNMKPQIEAPQTPDDPPWRKRRATIDTSLTERIDKKLDPAINRQVALEYMENFDRFTHCFTDGSLSDGKAGSAFCIPECDVGDNFRLTEHVTIYTAELIAIREILKFIRSNHIPNPVIFSDSLGSLLSLQSERSTSRPNLQQEILFLIDDVITTGSDVQLCWIPSHVGLDGNDTADTLARDALSKPQPDLEVPLELKEAYKLVDKHILDLWQKEWNAGTTARAYHKTVPIVSGKIKYSDKVRKKETMITRLRIGQCHLNHSAHKRKVHKDGFCQNCKVPETVKHFLTECTANTALINSLKSICQERNLPFETSNLLNIGQACDEIFHYAVSIDKKI